MVTSWATVILGGSDTSSVFEADCALTDLSLLETLSMLYDEMGALLLFSSTLLALLPLLLLLSLASTWLTLPIELVSAGLARINGTPVATGLGEGPKDGAE